MADKKNKNLFQRLRGLFSSNVIVRNVGGKKIKAVDFNNRQTRAKSTNFLVDRYTRMHSTKNTGYGYPQGTDAQIMRMTLFNEYDEMDSDAIIASALDIYADESTMKNEFGDVLTIKTDNSKVHEVLHNLYYDVLNIEFNLWPWVRNLVKYGDFFLKLDIAENYGVVGVNPLPAAEVVREEGYDEENPTKVRFRIEGPSQGMTINPGSISYLENYEMAHFRLLSDSNFVPYGKAMIEGARKTWKQLMLMEDAMLVHRIMRAPEKRVFKIDIGNIPPNEVDNYMQQIINKSKKVPLVDSKTGEYNLKYNMQNITEDFYLPVRGGDSGTQIDNLPGLTYEATEDIEYLRNKMMAALKVPKAFLGYEEQVEGKATLAAEDVRFARTVERIQRIISSELVKIGVIHLYSQGFTDADLVSFSLELTNSSTIYEQEKIELWNNKIGVASSMIQDKVMSSEWIYKNIFNFDDEQTEKVRSQIIDDQKRKFRFEQIETEGNDPFKTNQSFGTPHDLATLQQSENGEEGGKSPFGEDFDVPDGGWEGSGRPKESNNKWKTDKNTFGRDPLGSKTMKTPVNFKRDTSYKNGSPLSQEQINNITNDLKRKTKGIISESLTNKQDSVKKASADEDKNTILDEKNIKDIE